MKKVKKILTIVSIVIIVVGIALAIGTSSQFSSNTDPANNVYVDGTDFTAISNAFTTIAGGLLGSILGFFIMFYCIIAVCAIWIVYGIIILIIKILNKIKK